MPADGSPSSPPPRRHGLTDASLRVLVLELGPLAELDTIAGLRARSRDPREMPGTGGEQRDAAAALDAASDRGTLAAARLAWVRLHQLGADHRATGLWIAEHAGAVRRGALVGVEEWALTYARLEGPRGMREADERAREQAMGAEVRLAAAKAAIRGGMTEPRARELESAKMAHDSAVARAPALRAELAAWGRDRLEALGEAWEATTGGADDTNTRTEG